MKQKRKLNKVIKVEKQTRKSKSKKQTVSVGSTLKTKDEYLPFDKSKVKELKNKRWVAVIDKNKKGEFAVVKLTTQRTKNTTELKGYSKGNKKTTYFGHFVEIKDNEGNPIKVSVKFKANQPKYDLTSKQVKQIKEKVLNGVKQASQNKKNIKDLRK